MTCDRYEGYWREIHRENGVVINKSKAAEQRLIGVYEYWYAAHGSWNRLQTELSALPALTQTCNQLTANLGMCVRAYVRCLTRARV